MPETEQEAQQVEHWTKVREELTAKPPAPAGILKRFSATFRPGKPNRKLMMCEKCREFYWDNAPQRVIKRHLGHRIVVAERGNFHQALQVKLGLTHFDCSILGFLWQCVVTVLVVACVMRLFW